MASPISHTLTGFALAALFRGGALSLPGSWRILLFAAVLANLPDLDFLIGPFMGASPNAHHQIWTHGIAFWLVASLLLTPLAQVRPEALKNWLFCALAVGSHLVIDFFTGPALGFTRSYGLPLLAPFSREKFYSSISLFVGPKKSTSAELFSAHNFLWAGVEFVVFGTVLAAVLWWCGHNTASRISPTSANSGSGTASKTT